MTEIKGQYFENLGFTSFKANIPSSWKELETIQAMYIIQMLSYTNCDKHRMAVSLLTLLFKPVNFHILKHLDDEQLSALIPLTNFLYEERPNTNLNPQISVKGQILLAPAADLSNIGFGEWCFANQYFLFYRMTKEEQYADKLIATLYRPKDNSIDTKSPDYLGDSRQRFNENLISLRLPYIKALKDHQRTAILLWFTTALNEVCRERPHVFPEPAQMAPGENPPEPEYNGQTWLTVFRELLGPKWGTTETLKHTNALFILDELEDRHIAFLAAN